MARPPAVVRSALAEQPLQQRRPARLASPPLILERQVAGHPRSEDALAVGMTAALAVALWRDRRWSLMAGSRCSQNGQR